jgi:hypothetical protein
MFLNKEADIATLSSFKDTLSISPPFTYLYATLRWDDWTAGLLCGTCGSGLPHSRCWRPFAQKTCGLFYPHLSLPIPHIYIPITYLLPGHIPHGQSHQLRLCGRPVPHVPQSKPAVQSTHLSVAYKYAKGGDMDSVSLKEERVAISASLFLFFFIFFFHLKTVA